MSSWINKAKETLNEVIDQVVKETQEEGNLKVRVSFIGYRDLEPRNPNPKYERFEKKDFTDDIDSVRKFIAGCKADGGDDGPEDMQGGLKLCLL